MICLALASPAMRDSVRFNASIPGCDRVHPVTEDDVRVLLGRLPAELWRRLRAVHFNDRSRGVRTLGYVNRGHREIALCALPPRVSLTRFLTRGQSPAQFGAWPGEAWPAVAVRRFLLYDVFLHELGHLQVVDPTAQTLRRRFAGETKAQEFAIRWCRRLWAQPFEHPDPVHNSPGEAELGDDDPDMSEYARRTRAHPEEADLFQQLGRELFKRGRRDEAKTAYLRSLALDPTDPWTHLWLGNWHYEEEDLLSAIEWFSQAARLLPHRSVAFWCLADAQQKQGQIDLAGANYRRAVVAEPFDKCARRKLLAWRKRSRESRVEASVPLGGPGL